MSSIELSNVDAVPVPVVEWFELGHFIKERVPTLEVQAIHPCRKSITTIGDGLHYMHQASLKGDFAKAAEWFEKLCALSDFQVEANTINTVIQAAANVGNVKEAKSWFQKLSEYDLNATQESYTSMISAAAKRRMVPEAEKYFQEMKAQEIEPDDVAYGALLSAFARVGDLERAEKYFNMMERGSGDLKPNQIVLGTAPGQCNQHALCVATQKDRRVEQIVSLLKLVISK